MNTDKLVAEAIAEEYAPKDDSKLIALRKLDRHAKLPAVIFAYSFGIAAVLVAGTGMCLSMRVIGAELPYALGIAVGLLGFVGCGVNYPIYRRLLERGKAKYAYEIISLAREISESEAE